MTLCEWEKHVIKNGGDWPQDAWCGETVWRWSWAFLDADHARESEARGSRLLMCPKCKKAIAKASRPGPTNAPED